MVSVSYDKESGAIYVRLLKEKVAKTISVGSDRFIDVDESGKAVGIEILLPKTMPEVEKAIMKSSSEIELLQ